MNDAQEEFDIKDSVRNTCDAKKYSLKYVKNAPAL